MNFKPWLTLALLTTTMSSAVATVIDFNDLDNGTRVDTEYFSEYGITFNGTNVAQGGADNLAVIFDTTLTQTADPDLEGDFSNANLGDLNAGNVLVIQEDLASCNELTCTNPDDEGAQPSGYFSIDFENGVTLNSIDFFDIEFDEATSDNAINLFAFDGSELNAGQFFTPGTGGNNTWDQLTFDVADVYSIEINLKGSGAISNLDFTANSTASVPAPATIGLLSLALFGLMSTRRRGLM